MDPRAREVLAFVGRAAGVILALALVWPWLAPVYSQAAAAGGNRLFELQEHPVRLIVDDAGRVGAYQRVRDRNGRWIPKVSPIGIEGSWEGVLLFTALMAATPRLTRRRRLTLLIVGGCLLAGYHAVFAMLYFKAFAAPEAHRLLFAWFPVSEAVIPIVLWGVLSFRHWLPGLRPELRSAGDRSSPHGA